MTRNKDGMLSLEVNDRHANQKQTNNKLKETGEEGITIGGERSGKRFALGDHAHRTAFNRPSLLVPHLLVYSADL